MPFGAAALVAGGLGAAGILGSSLISSDAATSASKMQAGAATRAADIQGQEFLSTQNNMLPFLRRGSAGMDALLGQLGFGVDGNGGLFFTPGAGQILQNPMDKLGMPPTYNMPAFDAAQYHQSPGYSFALQGGTDALQNAGATRTGALSGNVLKALQGFGVGQANQDYQQNYQNFATNYGNQFSANNSNYWNRYNAMNQGNANTFNWLNALSGSGQNAAANLGTMGGAAAGNIGNALIGAGNAQAAGTVGSANAMSGGINSLATLLNAPGGGNNSLLSALIYGRGGGGGFDASASGGVY